jgi:hypothetical protein
MPVVNKEKLKKTLDRLTAFDQMASPYIGVQFTGDDLLFHRSGPVGFIQSVGYDQQVQPIVVSLKHFALVVSNLQDERVDVVANRGSLRVHSTREGATDDCHVYTLHPEVAWRKVHLMGNEAVKLTPTAFEGVDIRPFLPLTTPPVLRDGCLVLATNYGIVMRENIPLNPPLYPRDTFLRAVCGQAVEHVGITEQGYWTARVGSLVLAVSGHNLGEPLFRTYRVPSERIATFEANRLIHALQATANICGTSTLIEWSAEQGLVAGNQVGNSSTFSLIGTGTFPRFHLAATACDMLVNTLKQGNAPEVHLSEVHTTTLRLERGDWSINFRR